MVGTEMSPFHERIPPQKASDGPDGHTISKELKQVQLEPKSVKEEERDAEGDEEEGRVGDHLCGEDVASQVDSQSQRLQHHHVSNAWPNTISQCNTQSTYQGNEDSPRGKTEGSKEIRKKGRRILDFRLKDMKNLWFWTIVILRKGNVVVDGDGPERVPERLQVGIGHVKDGRVGCWRQSRCSLHMSNPVRKYIVHGT